MDEILALQDQLRKLQQQSSHNRLSERNCVELIMRLVELGKLTVYFTQDGKEYVTPEQLESEIHDELLQHGGKLGILNLPTLLNVDLSYIEARLSDMLKRSRRLQIVNGEIMTRYYLDGIAQEINEGLGESGHVVLTDLALRFGLTSDFLAQVIQERLGKTIKGHLEQGSLYTHLFIDRCKAQMRAAFSAVTRPTALTQIISLHSFNERLFFATLDEIKNEPRFAGVIDRGVYIPHIYSQTRKKWIESFLAQNGFIEYSKLSQINVPEPKRYLLANFPEGLPLDSCFISDSIIQQVDASVDHVLSNNSWLDVRAVVEFQLSAKDAVALLKSCPSFISAKEKEAPLILNDNYLVSKGLLERCIASLKDKLNSEIPKKTQLIIEALTAKPITKAADEEESKGKGRSAGRKGAKGKAGSTKGGKANQKGKRKDKGRDDDGDEIEPRRNTTQSSKAALQEVLNESEVRACLRQWYEDAEAAFLDSLYQHIRSYVRELNKAALETIQQQASTGKKKDHKALEQQFSVLYQNIQLFCRSAEEVAGKDAALSEALRRHLLATLCTEATNLLVYMMGIHYDLPLGDKITISGERKEVISQLPLTVATPLAVLSETLKGSGVDVFLQRLENLSEEAQLHLKPLDKKKQRLLTHTHKLDFLEQLKEATEPPLVFHLSTAILYAQLFNLALHMPGRLAHSLVAELSQSLPPELSDALKKFADMLKNGEPIDITRIEELKNAVVEFTSKKK